MVGHTACVLGCVQLFCDPMDWPTRFLCPWSSPGNGVGCHSLLQGIFPTQGSILGSLHCSQILYHLSHQGSHNLSFQYFLAADGEGLCEGLPFLILLLSHSVQPVVCLPRSTVVLGLGWALFHARGLRQHLTQSGCLGHTCGRKE